MSFTDKKTLSKTALAIENYIIAKDGNRPDLLRRAFISDASLEMIVQTNAISFPSNAAGREAIADILVSKFGATYENVYTFCLGEQPSPNAASHTHKWLVGMSTKATGEVRLGCGFYEWQFQPVSGLVERLCITIEHMHIYPAAQLRPVMEWLQSLPYPWCPLGEIFEQAPQVSDIAPIIDYLKD